MKRIILAAAIGLGVFTVVTAKPHVVTTASRTIVSDTDTTKKPVPDSLSLAIAQ